MRNELKKKTVQKVLSFFERRDKMKEELIEKINRLENDKQNLYILLALIIIAFIIYIFKINRTSKSPLST